MYTLNKRAVCIVSSECGASRVSISSAGSKYKCEGKCEYNISTVNSESVRLVNKIAYSKKKTTLTAWS